MEAGVQCDASAVNSKMESLQLDVAGAHPLHKLWDDAGTVASRGRGLQQEQGMGLLQPAVLGTMNRYQSLKDDEEDRIDGYLGQCHPYHNRASRTSSSVLLSFASGP